MKPIAVTCLLVCIVVLAAQGKHRENVNSLQTTEAWAVRGPAGEVVYSLAIDSSNASIVYAGTEHGVYKSTDAGLNWNQTTLSQGRADTLAISQSKAGTIYAAASFADSFYNRRFSDLYRSENGGATWVNLGRFVTDPYNKLALGLDSFDAAIIYAGDYRYVYKSTDAGMHFTIISNFGASSVGKIAIDTNIPSTIYVAISSSSYILKSIDGGTTWVKINDGHPPDVSDIAVDPSDGNIVYLAAPYSVNFPSGVYKSVNGGTSWSAVGLQGIQTEAVSIDPTNPAIVYAGTLGAGVYRSLDGGSTWSAFNNGLSNTNVNGLEIDPTGRHLYALTTTGVFDYQYGDNGCAYSIVPSSQTFNSGGGTGSVSVTAPNGCSWTARRNVNWISIGSARSGVGPRTVNYSVEANTSLDARSGTLTIANQTFTINQPSVAKIQFDSSSYSAAENIGSVSITVTRTGDTSGTSMVNYALSDGSANQKQDYTTAAGILTFSPGETSKTFPVLIVDDAYVEGNETLNLTLSNPDNASLVSPNTAILTIVDNDSTAAKTNPIDDARFFVQQHYFDFLNRSADQGGLDYWTDQIAQCGLDSACINSRRIGVSAAFFIELEFQETGYVVYRLYRAAYGTLPGAPSRANLLYAPFMSDRASLVGGLQLPQSTTDFAGRFVQRATFKQAYPDTMTEVDFVNKLFDTAGLAPYTAERQQLAADMLFRGKTRSQALIDVIEIAEFKNREYNSAFVLMQYFGYLRRDPDQGGYDFWLNVLNNREPNNFRGMVCAFITSAEYQDRFSFVRTRTDSLCGQ